MSLAIALLRCYLQSSISYSESHVTSPHTLMPVHDHTLSLHLPGSFWMVIAVFMFFERAVATGGSYLVIKGLQAAMPNLMAKSNV